MRQRGIAEKPVEGDPVARLFGTCLRQVPDTMISMRTLNHLGCLIVFLSSFAWTHDLYLVSGVKGAEQKICARIGEEFPASTNAVTTDRINSFRLMTARQTVALKGEVTEKQYCAPIEAPEDGVAEMTVQPRFIRLSAKDFNGYVHGEGLASVVQIREQRQQTEAEGRELYSRYSKLLLGRIGDLATRAIGHALEIVPEQDPASLAAGDTLTVTVLFRGKPLANAQVSAVYSGAKLHGHEYPVTTRTDSNGRAILKLDRPGLWYARLIYMVPAENDPEVDWRSYFSTLTFSIGDERQPPAAGKGDRAGDGMLWDVDKVESTLTAAGLKGTRDARLEQPFLSVPGRAFVIREGEAEIQIYTYRSTVQRAADTDKLDPKTATPPTMRAAWIMPPSLITNRNLAAIVLTRNEALRQKIASVLNK